MPDKVTFDENLQIVRVKSDGVVTAEDQRATLASVLRVHQEQRISGVFVDATRVTSSPPTWDVFVFGLEAAERLGGLRVAIAAPLGIYKATNFFETVARNRMANVRVFDSSNDALAWLRTESNGER